MTEEFLQKRLFEIAYAKARDSKPITVLTVWKYTPQLYPVRPRVFSHTTKLNMTRFKKLLRGETTNQSDQSLRFALSDG